MDGRDLRQELAELRQQLRRNQVYLVGALAAIGLGALVSIGLVGFYGTRLADEIFGIREDVREVGEQSHTRTRALSLDLAKQQQELAAIRKAANAEMEAIQEAHRKIAAIRDPRKELSALREANQALWSELARQRAEILDALEEEDAATAAVEKRFKLGETNFADPEVRPGEVRGFIVEDEKVYRASPLKGNPAHLVIELSPEKVKLGDRYELAVRLVNRTNQPLDARALRLDWSFGGKKTGGDVPLGVARVDARASAVLYHVSGQWTPAHEESPVRLTATLTLNGGERLANTLSWAY